MKRIALAATCAALAIGAIPVGSAALSQSAPPAAVPADLALVQKHIRAITTLSAAFSQTDRTGQVQTGRFLWKQPGHIRFQYGGDAPLLIVADGRSLYMVDYEVAQVQRWPIRNSPLGALLDPARDVTRYGTLIQTGSPDVLSVDVRDPDHPEYGVINLVFKRQAGAPAGLSLYGWVARDAQGNRTTIRLAEQRYGAPIADSAFRWRDPRGAKRGAGR